MFGCPPSKNLSNFESHFPLSLNIKIASQNSHTRTRVGSDIKAKGVGELTNGLYFLCRQIMIVDIQNIKTSIPAK